MKKKTAVGALAITALILAGCFGRKGDANSKKDFPVEVCNDYIQYMRCVADSPETPYGQEVIDQLIQAWKPYTADQLQNACTIALKNAIDDISKTSINCTAPESAQNISSSSQQNTTSEDSSTKEEHSSEASEDSSSSTVDDLSGGSLQEDNSGAVDSPDSEIIGVITGKVDASQEVVDTAQVSQILQKDSKIVSMVVNEITTSF